MCVTAVDLNECVGKRTFRAGYPGRTEGSLPGDDINIMFLHKLEIEIITFIDIDGGHFEK